MITSVVSLVMSPVTTCMVTPPIVVSCIPELETTLEKGPCGSGINSSVETRC